MKEKIHPEYYQVKAKCACGSTYDVGSTKKEINMDICAGCHPLFTGKQKLLDTEGRVQRFKKKYQGIKVSTGKKGNKKKVIKKTTKKKK